jgi:hypothetical protein
MDKNSLKKHHFWILLGLAVVLIPIACSGAMLGVGGAAEEKTKKIEAKLTDLNKQKPRSDEYRAKLGEQKEELQKQKDRVWQDAYKAQAGLIRWPSALNRLNELADKGQLFFGDPIDDSDRNTFRSPDVYRAEYLRLPGVIAPTQFPEHNWQNVLTRYPEFKTLPSTEDVWLALEDLCVQREVLRDVHAVNQMLAEFLPVPLPVAEPAVPKGKAPEELKRYAEDRAKYQKDKEAYDEAKRKVDEEMKALYKAQSNEFAGRFISPYWQLDIVVGRPSQGRAGELNFRGRLTNTSGRRQNAAEIDFKVWLTNQPNVDYILLPIEAELGYMAADQSIDFNLTRPGASDPTLKIFRVEQKLTPRYVPVKQVVQLNLDYPSHRFANVNRVTAAFSQEEITKAAAAAPPPSGPPGAPAGAAGPGADTGFTQNGVPRYRYVERNEQVRRMDVAIVMIVDQAHVQDVIRALANSRLRFQNTQVHYERYRGVISLDEPSESEPPTPGVTAAGAPLPPGLARGVPRGGLRIGVSSKGRGGPAGEGRREQRMPRPGMPPGMSSDPNAADEENNNLVELTVYGIISLYERYPPKPAAGQPGAPGAAPVPGAPAAPPPPPPPVGAPIPPPAAPAPVAPTSRGDLPKPG